MSSAFQSLRVAVVGNFNPPASGVRYQAEVLADNFAAEGACVRRVTFQQNRYLRPLWTLGELVLHAGEYDVICIQAFSFGSWINTAVSMFAGRLLGKRIVVVYRGGAFPEFMARYRRVVRPVMRLADQLVVPSGFLDRAMRQHALDAEVIPNVIALADWPYRRRERLAPALLWVRHLRAGYNPWMAVQTLRLVQQRYPDATLRMAGDGPMEREMRARIQTEGVRGVTLLGHLPMATLQRHYQECDVFISTTNYDNQPRSVLEAMASGLPVVSTNVGGVPDLIQEGVNGLLVPAGDAGAMADAVLTLLEQPADAQRLSEAGLRTVRAHSWDAVRGRWFALLTGVTSQEASV